MSEVKIHARTALEEAKERKAQDIEDQVGILDALADVAEKLRTNLWDDGAYPIPKIVQEIRNVAILLEVLQAKKGDVE